MIKKILLSLSVVLLVQGCGASSNVRPPSPLVEIDSTNTVEVLWDESFGSSKENRKLQLSTAAIDSTIFTVTSTGKLTAFNAKDGDDLWSVSLDYDITGGVGVSGKFIFLATRNGHLLALSSKNGELIWNKRITTTVLSAPIYANDKVIVQSVEGKVIALDESTGKEIWVYKKDEPSFSLRGTSSPIVIGNVVITGFATGTIVAIALENGKQIWELPVSQPSGRNEIERLSDVDAKPVVADFRLFVANYHGKIVCIDLRSGEQIWSRDLSVYRNMTIDKKNIYALDERGVMHAFSQETGSTMWQQAQFLDRNPSSPAVVGNNVLVGDMEGFVHWLNVDDGRVLGRVQIDDSAIVSAALVKGSVAYVNSIGGVLAAVRLN